MTCDTVRPYLSLIAAGSLESSHARRVDEHLGECADCQASLAKTRKLRSLLALKRHEQPDEFFMRTFTAEFHRRVCSEMVQKPSFRQKLTELISIARQRMGIVHYSSAAALAVLVLSVFVVHISTSGISSESPKGTVIAQAASVSTEDRSVVAVESRHNELVLATGQPKSVYVLDRVQYEPATHGSVVLAF